MINRLRKILGLLVVVVVAFCGYASTRESKFHYERSAVIASTPDVIFPYLDDLHKGDEWSPFQKGDPTMKETFSGAESGVGSHMDFKGEKSGSGHLDILKVAPNESVEFKLVMTEPFHAENDVVYKLTPEAGGTRFTWAMSGDGGFVMKLMSIFIDCEKMIGDTFSDGINNLKIIVEGKKS